jgi:hypothetical protein
MHNDCPFEQQKRSELIASVNESRAPLKASMIALKWASADSPT